MRKIASSGIFEWDVIKDKINLSKHGVNFQTATLAFTDPKAVFIPDNLHSQIESRWYCIGRVENEVLTVRFTVRDGRVRIFGAGYWRDGRKAYDKETE